MIQIQELIKHFVLGIASIFILNNVMADDTKIRNFANEIREVKEEYGKDSFEYSKDSIRAFLKLISTGSAYDNVRKSIEQGQPVEKLFMNMGSYAEKSDYPQFLNTVYRTRVNEILNPILPKRKPLNAQMKGLN